MLCLVHSGGRFEQFAAEKALEAQEVVHCVEGGERAGKWGDVMAKGVHGHARSIRT